MGGVTPPLIHMLTYNEVNKRDAARFEILRII